jgi:predicted transcriptional regulator
MSNYGNLSAPVRTRRVPRVLTEKELQVLVLRKDGVKQTEIAKRMGITQGAVSRFEANARAKIQVAQQQLDLLRKLGITFDDEQLGLEERLRALKRGGKR